MTDPILAKAFACADSTEQAALIDSFARELWVICGGRFSKHSALAGYEPQCCDIAKKLKADGKKFIKDLHAFIELYEKDME